MGRTARRPIHHHGGQVMTITLFLCTAFGRDDWTVGPLIPLSCMACDMIIAYWVLT